MDDNSRNVVKFIAAATGTILVIMGIWFAIRPPAPQPASPPPANAQVAQPEANSTPDEEVSEPSSDAQRFQEDEEFAPISGEPTTEFANPDPDTGSPGK
ncbi:MAG: hypothetical protein WBO17_09910 [Sphingorhabdus sp.]